MRVHAALRGCDALEVLGIETVGHRTSRRMITGVCEMYTDDQARQDASRAPIAPAPPLPGEGKACFDDADTQTGHPPPCPDPLICSKNVCASPYR
jgi:hypothetical protein